LLFVVITGIFISNRKKKWQALLCLFFISFSNFYCESKFVKHNFDLLFSNLFESMEYIVEFI